MVGSHSTQSPGVQDVVAVASPVDTTAKASDTEETLGRTRRRYKGAERALSFGLLTLVGMNDSATGANLSAMQEHYQVGSGVISTAFLAVAAGYLVSCITSSLICKRLGVRDSLMVAGGTASAGYLALSFAPPFPMFIISIAIIGFGSGLLDSVLTTVISHEESTQSMSLLYASFGIGAMVSPLLVGALIDRGIRWNYYYFIPLGISIGLTTIVYPIFASYQTPPDAPSDADPGSPKSPTSLNTSETTSALSVSLEKPSQTAPATRASCLLVLRRQPWACFALIALVFASGDIVSGWMVSYMTRVRGAPAAASRYELAGYWGGIAAGRILLARACRSLGCRDSSLIALLLTSTCLAVVWAVPDAVAGACAFAFVGVFQGPLIPNILTTVGVGVAPSRKGAVVGLTIGIGLVGAAIGPLVFGVLAGEEHISSLPGVLIVTSFISGVVWLVAPRGGSRAKDLEEK